VIPFYQSEPTRTLSDLDIYIVNFKIERFKLNPWDNWFDNNLTMLKK